MKPTMKLTPHHTVVCLLFTLGVIVLHGDAAMATTWHGLRVASSGGAARRLNNNNNNNDIPECTEDEYLTPTNTGWRCERVDCGAKYGNQKPIFDDEVRAVVRYCLWVGSAMC